MTSKKTKNKKGFTLVEILISIFILSLLTVVVNTFARDVFYLGNTLSGSMSAQLDGRHLIKTMVSELREAEPSSLGAYPIAVADPSAITFYSNINSDGLQERVRYYLVGTDLKKGVMVPSGSPLSYGNTESVTTLATGVVSSSTLPIFQYYSSAYSGTEAPLAQPVNITSIRLVKITIIIDKDPTHAPSQIVITSQVSLRNLKDNL
jgi:prepilin-type N-terminal cleavage/methylation domain-containing protein